MPSVSRNSLVWPLVKILIGIVLVSVSLAFAHALFILPWKVRSGPLFYAAVGLALGLIIFASVSPFMPVYVLGHEFTHWLIAKVFRRRTGAFRVGGDSGCVHVERPNIWIILGPYFVPIYSFVWVVLCSLYRAFRQPGWYPIVLFGGMGLTYAFHCVLTIKVLRSGQSDLQHYGHFFSMLLIIAVNLGVIYVALAVLSGNAGAAPGCLLRAFQTQLQVLNRWL